MNLAGWCPRPDETHRPTMLINTVSSSPGCVGCIYPARWLIRSIQQLAIAANSDQITGGYDDSDSIGRHW
jgi:hypothetical protein